MRTRTKVALITFVTLIALYWFGVYLSGIKIERGMDLVGNYIGSIFMAVITTLLAGSVPIDFKDDD